jgi:hypothetical protein
MKEIGSVVIVVEPVCTPMNVMAGVMMPLPPTPPTNVIPGVLITSPPAAMPAKVIADVWIVMPFGPAPTNVIAGVRMVVDAGIFTAVVGTAVFAGDVTTGFTGGAIFGCCASAGAALSSAHSIAPDDRADRMRFSE